MENGINNFDDNRRDWNDKNKKTGWKIVNFSFWKFIFIIIFIAIILEHGIIGYALYDGKLDGLIKTDINNTFENFNNVTIENEYEFKPSNYLDNFNDNNNNFTIYINNFIQGNCS